jgi:hypothetical protein
VHMLRLNARPVPPELLALAERDGRFRRQRHGAGVGAGATGGHLDGQRRGQFDGERGGQRGGDWGGQFDGGGVAEGPGLAGRGMDGAGLGAGATAHARAHSAADREDAHEVSGGGRSAAGLRGFVASSGGGGEGDGGGSSLVSRASGQGLSCNSSTGGGSGDSGSHGVLGSAAYAQHPPVSALAPVGAPTSTASDALLAAASALGAGAGAASDLADLDAFFESLEQGRAPPAPLPAAPLPAAPLPAALPFAAAVGAGSALAAGSKPPGGDDISAALSRAEKEQSSAPAMPPTTIHGPRGALELPARPPTSAAFPAATSAATGEEVAVVGRKRARWGPDPVAAAAAAATGGPLLPAAAASDVASAQASFAPSAASDWNGQKGGGGGGGGAAASSSADASRSVRPRRFGPEASLVGSGEPSATAHGTTPGSSYAAAWAASMPPSGGAHRQADSTADAAYPFGASGIAPAAPAALGPTIPGSAAGGPTAHAAGTIAAFRAQAQALLAAKGLAPQPGTSRSHYVPGMRY